MERWLAARTDKQKKNNNQSRPETFLWPLTVHFLTIDIKRGRHGKEEGEEEQQFVSVWTKSLALIGKIAKSKQNSVSASVCACFWVPACMCVSGGETVVMLDQADCVGWDGERAPQPENTFSLRRLPCSQPAVLLCAEDLSCFFSLVPSLLLFVYQHTSTFALSTIMKLTSEIPLWRSSNLIPHHKPIIVTFDLMVINSTHSQFPTWLWMVVTSAKVKSPVLPAV